MRFHNASFWIAAGALAFFGTGPARGQGTPGASQGTSSKLVAPAKGHISVAFVLTEGAVMIDFAGPWEVFQDVHVDSRGASMQERMPFDLYTVSDSKKPIHISGGMQVVPDYTFEDAPPPRVVVVPAQGGKSPKMLDWIRKMTTQADVVMSVCTGAFKLGAAGVLDGKKATTHHASYDRFQQEFPKILVQRGRRYVQSDPVVFTAGGLSSGIDLALHIVELYFGRGVAEGTARYMEYEGKGWMGDGAAVAAGESVEHPEARHALGSGPAPFRPQPSGKAAVTSTEMAAFLVWLVLLVLCWPLAVLALVLYPIVWLLLLPFRLVGLAVEGVFRLLAAIILLPARLLRGPRPSRLKSREPTARTGRQVLDSPSGCDPPLRARANWGFL